MTEVTFTYHTGSCGKHFQDVRLTGNWTDDGRQSEARSVAPMEEFRDETGCTAYRATVSFAESEIGKPFSWNVVISAPGRADLPGIAAESGPLDAPSLDRQSVLDPSQPEQSYRVTRLRFLGANKYWREGEEKPAIRFAVWAPHAKAVETVIASDDGGGYIWNDGRGVSAAYAMTRDASGVWTTDPADPALADYQALSRARYMFRITREDGSVAYRTDLYSRCQAGKGNVNPEESEWSGKAEDLESTESCSVVKDPDTVNAAADGDAAWTDADAFWAHEYSSLRPVPSHPDELVIYEMHVAGLGAGHEGPGTLADALGMLDYLDDLGINAVELLPMSEFEDAAGWGYGSSHFHAIKYDPEGRDLFKLFVRECHRRGMAVIVDVVYNHYSPDSERVHWMYDTLRHDHNTYFFITASRKTTRRISRKAATATIIPRDTCRAWARRWFAPC